MTDAIEEIRALADDAVWLIWHRDAKAWLRSDADGRVSGLADAMDHAGRWRLADAVELVLAAPHRAGVDIVPDPAGPYAETGLPAQVEALLARERGA